MNLNRPNTTNQKFMSIMETAAKEYTKTSNNHQTPTQNLDEYLSVTDFLHFNEAIDATSKRQAGDGSYIVRDFQMFDGNTLEPLPRDLYMKQVHCESIDQKDITQSAYKLL